MAAPGINQQIAVGQTDACSFVWSARGGFRCEAHQQEAWDIARSLGAVPPCEELLPDLNAQVTTFIYRDDATDAMLRAAAHELQKDAGQNRLQIATIIRHPNCSVGLANRLFPLVSLTDVLSEQVKSKLVLVASILPRLGDSVGSLERLLGEQEGLPGSWLQQEFERGRISLNLVCRAAQPELAWTITSKLEPTAETVRGCITVLGRNPDIPETVAWPMAKHVIDNDPQWDRKIVSLPGCPPEVFRLYMESGRTKPQVVEEQMYQAKARDWDAGLWAAVLRWWDAQEDHPDRSRRMALCLQQLWRLALG